MPIAVFGNPQKAMQFKQEIAMRHVIEASPWHTRSTTFLRTAHGQIGCRRFLFDRGRRFSLLSLSSLMLLLLEDSPDKISLENSVIAFTNARFTLDASSE